MSQTTFDRLGLPDDLVAALAAQRITEPFAIQGLTLPDALAGRDILGRAPTGSGKTLAFGLPSLARLAATDRASKRRPRALILSPTRELAEQIQRELAPLATAVKRRVAAVYGGASIGRQITALAKGVDLLVACPGRLLDLIDQGEVSLDQVELAVVDEADRMADMGFLPDVRRILDQTMDDRQTLLFSATLDGDVQTLTDRYQNDPALHEIGDPEPDLSTVEHRFIKIRKPDRMDVAADLITEAGATVVFVRTRHGVDRLARQLRQRGVKAGYIHGGRTQSQRARALELFTDGRVDALVATDVAARGIHVDGVACVLHYDPPAEIKDYVHRSGRTARAGAGGTVISFLDPAQVKPSQKMQRELGIEAELEAPPTPRPRPVIADDDRNADDEGGATKGRDRKRRDGGDRTRDRKARDGKARGGTARDGKARDGKARGGNAREATGRTDRPSGRRDDHRRSTTTEAGSDRPRSRRDRSEDVGDDGSRGRGRGSASSSGRRSGWPAAGAGPKGRGRAGGTRRDGSARDDAGGRGRRGDDRSRGRGRARAAGWDEGDGDETTRSTDRSSGERGTGQGREAAAGTGRSGPPRSGKAKAKAKSAGAGKARAKRATKRSGRSRPPNRKGKLGAKGRRSKTSG